MQGLLEEQADQGLAPNGGSTRLPSLANQNVAKLKSVSVEFIVLEVHLCQVAKIE